MPFKSGGWDAEKKGSDDDDCHDLERNSKEGKDLFRKSIICYQIYSTIYSQLESIKKQLDLLFAKLQTLIGTCKALMLIGR